MAKVTYRNHMTIRQDHKGVPYGGDCTPRSDGEANHGFVCLKGRPEASTAVPELARDPAMLALVNTLNERQSGFFTVGCTSGDVSESSGYRRSGYVEFAATPVTL